MAPSVSRMHVRLRIGHEVMAIWRRRVSWRGFLRRQRAGAIVAGLALIMPVLVVGGWRGPLVRVHVLDDFFVRPWPAACFLGALSIGLI